MADNLKRRGTPDTKTIGQALAGAVRTVGKSAKKVEQYLKEK
jgi:hypothetical protein